MIFFKINRKLFVRRERNAMQQKEDFWLHNSSLSGNFERDCRMESVHNSLTAVSHNYDAILINLTNFPAKSIVKQLFKYKC